MHGSLPAAFASNTFSLAAKCGEAARAEAAALQLLSPGSAHSMPLPHACCTPVQLPCVPLPAMVRGLNRLVVVHRPACAAWVAWAQGWCTSVCCGSKWRLCSQVKLCPSKLPKRSVCSLSRPLHSPSRPTGSCLSTWKSWLSSFWWGSAACIGSPYLQAHAGIAGYFEDLLPASAPCTQAPTLYGSL